MYKETIKCKLLGVPHPAFGDEAIADPWLGLDVLPAGLVFELFAQLADKHAQILRLMRRLRRPTPR